MFEPFKQFLVHRGSIKPQYVPFYLKWVSECYTFLNVIPASRLNGDQRKQFLADMSKSHEVRSFYDQDRKENLNGVWLPGALEKKYPNAGKEWGWFWLFPSKSISVDPRSLAVRRHHVHPASLQKAFKVALGKRG